jgi:hypothetical protein
MGTNLASEMEAHYATFIVSLQSYYFHVIMWLTVDLVDRGRFCQYCSGGFELCPHPDRFLGDRDLERRTFLGRDILEILSLCVRSVLLEIAQVIYSVTFRIEWARKYGLRIFLDLHALPGEFILSTTFQKGNTQAVCMVTR